VAATRVLILFSTLGVGGAERQLSVLAPGLRRAGLQLRVATLRERGRFFDELRDAGVETVHIGMRSRFDVAGAVRVYRLWQGQPDVVLTQGLNAQVLGHAVARRAGAAHVTIEQGGPGLARSRERRLLLRLVATRVDRVVPVASSQIPELRRLGYRADAIRVVPNGSSQPVPTRSRADVRRELGIDTEDVLVLLPAALRPEKRADRFVDAVAHAHAREPRIRGVVAGGGPLLDAVRQQAGSRDGAVLVLGERADVPDLMASADVVCLSSDVEGIPLAALEAMALRRPLVATAVGGLRDVVVGDRTGLLIPLEDDEGYSGALVELARDPARRARFGQEAYERYRTLYTSELMIERYANLIREVAATPHAEPT
jgi:glycosyltransferase involved in cell wall biosynthesis